MSLRPSVRTEVRRSHYKVAVDAEDGQRRREDNKVEIRKNRREESLQKKRWEGLPNAQQFATVAASSLFDKKIESLSAMVVGVHSDDPNAQLEATTHFRKLLSIGIELWRNPYLSFVSWGWWFYGLNMERALNQSAEVLD